MKPKRKLPAAAVATQFQPGNPGRPKGSRNKLGEAFIQALYDDFTDHGPDVIQAVRRDDPSTYMRVVAGILPKELEVKRPTNEMSDDELRSILTAVQDAVATAIASDGGSAGNRTPPAPVPEKPAGVVH